MNKVNHLHYIDKFTGFKFTVSFFVKDEEILYDLALCSEKDKFDKKVGRELSEKRLFESALNDQANRFSKAEFLATAYTHNLMNILPERAVEISLTQYKYFFFNEVFTRMFAERHGFIDDLDDIGEPSIEKM